MKFNIFSFKLLASLIFMLLFVFVELVSPKSAFADTYTLSGQVIDSAGTSISGVNVNAVDANTNASIGTTITDSSGNYSLIITGGTYNVQVTPPSGSNLSSAIALNQNVSSNTNLNFVLVNSTSAILSGHVNDPLGNGLPGQLVILEAGSTLIQTTTDNNGSFSLQANTGTYSLQFAGYGNSFALNAPGRYNLSRNGYSLTQSTIINITLPAKKVTVHVQDSSGNPVSNAKVQVPTTNVSNLSIEGNLTTSGYSDYGVGGFSQPQTDSSGNVTLWLFPNSSSTPYTFNVSPPDGSNLGSTSVSDIVVTNDMQQTVTLPSPVTLSGHVYDAHGNGVPDQLVILEAGGTQLQATTDSAGNYSIQAAIGTYSLQVAGYGNSFSLNVPGRYTLTRPGYSLSQNTVLDITLPTKKVDVHVQDAAGNPITNAKVQVSTVNLNDLSIGSDLTASGFSDYGVGGFSQPQTDALGNVKLWLFSNNSSSPYTFTVTPPTGSNFATTTISDVVVTIDTQRTITLQQPVTLSGHVYDPLGNGLPGQLVILEAGSTLIQTTTDSSGNYSLQANTGTYNIQIAGYGNSFSLDAPGRYNLSRNGYSLVQNTVLDITLPAKKVDLHIQDAAGNPITGVKIQVPTVNVSNLPIVNNLTASGYSDYGVGGFSQPQTDSSGNITLWLFPNSSVQPYTFNVNPPSGSPYSQFILENIVVSGDQTQVVSLQYNHAAPVTTATLVTEHADGTYSNPTTVTLSATAASEYTVANTYYRVDGGPQQTYSAPFTVLGDGAHTIEYWSVDNSGAQEVRKTKNFTIYVNQAPHVAPISGASINVGETYTESSLFTDADSTSWTATVDYGDGGEEQPLTFNTDKTFSLSHQYATAGTYTVTVVVRDDAQATGTTIATVTVLNNNPPVLEPIGNKTVAEGQILQFTVSAIDPDGDTLIYSAANLPPGASFNPFTQVFSWTPDFAQEGNYQNVEFTVTDSGTPMELDTELIIITVGNVNRAPVFDQLGSQEVLEDQLLTFIVSAIDPDGDSFILSAENLPQGASFDPQTGVFSWTPSLSQAGNYVVTFKATDNGIPFETGRLDVAITVSDNPTPTEQAENIVEIVIDYDFPTNVENSYLANLKKVAKFIEQGKVQPAINQLNAFIEKVEGDYANVIISQEERDTLINLAQALLNDLQ